jgi:hypothetical protein
LYSVLVCSAVADVGTPKVKDILWHFEDAVEVVKSEASTAGHTVCGSRTLRRAHEICHFLAHTFVQAAAASKIISKVARLVALAARSCIIPRTPAHVLATITLGTFFAFAWCEVFAKLTATDKIVVCVVHVYPEKAIVADTSLQTLASARRPAVLRACEACR